MSRVRRCATSLVVLVAVASGLSACSGSKGDSSAKSKPAFGHYQGALLSKPLALPKTALSSTDGGTLDLSTWSPGSLRLVFFGYTKCPDTCPTTMSDLAVALRKVPDDVRAKTHVVFVTTDPKRDSVSVMREWLGRFNKDFVGLTGSQPAITAAATALGVPLLAAEKLPDGGYDIPHGAQVIAVTPDNQAHLIWLGGTQVKQYESDIEKLLADPAYGGKA